MLITLSRLMVVMVFACGGSPRPAVPVGPVVFVCEHGAAKSVVAMAYFNQLAAARGLALRAIARGADPQDQPSQATAAGLRADGLSAELAPPRPVTGAELRGAARVVAFDCRQPAMTALRAMDACWDDVPAIGDGYPTARDRIRAHVVQIIDELSAPRRAP